MSDLDELLQRWEIHGTPAMEEKLLAMLKKCRQQRLEWAHPILQPKMVEASLEQQDAELLKIAKEMAK